MLRHHIHLFAISVLVLGGCQSASQSQSQSQSQPPAQESTAPTPDATPAPVGSMETSPSQPQASGSAAPRSNTEGSTADASSSSTSDDRAEPPLSEAEQAEQLDAELDESLAVFDGMILEQGAQIEAIRNSGDSGADGDGYDEGYGDGDTDGDQPLFEEGDLSADRGSGDPTGAADDGSGSDGESTGPSTSTARAGAGTMPGSGGKIPEDIPRGQDDDIVARQIREAAMQEKDPVLREKLWDEYRKYKNQQKAN